MLSLNFSLFDVDHTLMSFTQVTSFCMALFLSEGWKITYNCVSSAYITHLSPCCVMMSCKGALYVVNKIGPITDPCGTPKRRARSSERVPLVLTVCTRPFRYEVNHAKAEEVVPIWLLGVAARFHDRAVLFAFSVWNWVFTFRHSKYGITNNYKFCISVNKYQ